MHHALRLCPTGVSLNQDSRELFTQTSSSCVTTWRHAGVCSLHLWGQRRRVVSLDPPLDASGVACLDEQTPSLHAESNHLCSGAVRHASSVNLTPSNLGEEVLESVREGPRLGGAKSGSFCMEIRICVPQIQSSGGERFIVLEMGC